MLDNTNVAKTLSSFTFRKRKKVYRCQIWWVGVDVRPHRLIWKQETASHPKAGTVPWNSSQLLLLPYQIPRQGGYSPVLHPNGTSLPHIVTGPSRNCPAWTRIVLQKFSAFLKMCEPSNDFVHDSVSHHHHHHHHHTFFRSCYTSMAVFPDLQ
jgi:hypothetical protein